MYSAVQNRISPFSAHLQRDLLGLLGMAVMETECQAVLQALPHPLLSLTSLSTVSSKLYIHLTDSSGQRVLGFQASL